MTDLAFAFEAATVRVVVDDMGAPWWVARDVCAAVGLSKHRDALRNLRQGERGSMSVDTLGGRQLVSVVNEPGLYRLIFQSRDPAAERFKRWVLHEVLPTIRRDGAYALAHAPVTAPNDAELWLAMVREARLTYGRQAARVMWERSPLPPALPPRSSDHAERLCLDFLRDCCAITGAPGDFEPAGRLIARALEYCRDNGRTFPGRRTFSNALRRSVAASLAGQVWPVKRSNTGFAGLRLAA